MSKTQFVSSIDKTTPTSITELTGMTSREMLHLAMMRLVNKLIDSPKIKKLYDKIVHNEKNTEQVYPKIEAHCFKISDKSSLDKEIIERYIVVGYGTVDIKKDSIECKIDEKQFAKNLHKNIERVKPIFEPNQTWYCSGSIVLDSLLYLGVTDLEIHDLKIDYSPKPVKDSLYDDHPLLESETLNRLSKMENRTTSEYIRDVCLNGVVISKRTDFNTFALKRNLTLLGCVEYTIYRTVPYLL